MEEQSDRLAKCWVGTLKNRTLFERVNELFISDVARNVKLKYAGDDIVLLVMVRGIFPRYTKLVMGLKLLRWKTISVLNIDHMLRL